MLQLADPTLLERRAYIGGEWLDTGSVFPVFNPSGGEKICDVADVPLSLARQAIDAACAAKEQWAGLTGKQRSAIMRRMLEAIIANADDLATIITAEMGKPLPDARREILYGASFIEWFCEEAKRVYGDVIPSHQHDKRLLVLKQPIGVVGSITPWNFPNAMIARKLAPALAAGCTIVARPSELTPLSALALAVLGERAGIPPGVFNVLPSQDPQAIGLELCHNEKIAKITFTGSTEVGRLLMRQSAGTIKKMSLELGGNAAFIVFGDADPEAALAGAMEAKYRNSGQACVSADRFYVHGSLYDDFAAEMTRRSAELRPGDGFESGVNIGPLIDKEALAKVEAHVADAVARGATIMTGGRRSDLGGTFFQPTVITDVTSQMLIAREETFGPVAPLFRFEDEAEVIAQANNSKSGLAAYFYSNDPARIWRVAEVLETGMVGINTGLLSTEAAPFGGIKQSGIGREGSRYGIDDYLEMKYLCIGGVD